MIRPLLYSLTSVLLQESCKDRRLHNGHLHPSSALSIRSSRQQPSTRSIEYLRGSPFNNIEVRVERQRYFVSFLRADRLMQLAFLPPLLPCFMMRDIITEKPRSLLFFGSFILHIDLGHPGLGTPDRSTYIKRNLIISTDATSREFGVHHTRIRHQATPWHLTTTRNT